MLVTDFDYNLPQDLIAQTPVEPRDSSRLMVVDRQSGNIQHDHFYNLQRYITKDDQLVFNNSKVFPARLYGNKASGGKVEVLLIKKLSSKFQNPNSNWEVLIRNLGTEKDVVFDLGLTASVLEKNSDGTYIVEFNKAEDDFWRTLLHIGHVPLPPYIRYESNFQIPSTKNQINSKSQEANSSEYIKNRYQTVYAKEMGSAAAPTAGLHFTKELIERLSDQGSKIGEVTLHVGLGTFQPLQENTVEKNRLHSEYYDVGNFEKTGKIAAVGTTTVRVLESFAKTGHRNGETDIFIYPPYQFKLVDKMITNFHLPKSSLLMLVCAFAGKDLIMRAYEEAVKERYRFFSFGDAMLIV